MVYVLSYYPVGVASDFRYAYWAVVAGLVGAVVAAAPSRSLQGEIEGRSGYCFGAAGSDAAVQDL